MSGRDGFSVALGKDAVGVIHAIIRFQGRKLKELERCMVVSQVAARSSLVFRLHLKMLLFQMGIALSMVAAGSTAEALVVWFCVSGFLVLLSLNLISWAHRDEVASAEKAWDKVKESYGFEQDHEANR